MKLIEIFLATALVLLNTGCGSHEISARHAAYSGSSSSAAASSNNAYAGSFSGGNAFATAGAGAGGGAGTDPTAFWWQGPNSPFKAAYEYFKKCSQTGDCTNIPGPFAGIPNVGGNLPNNGCNNNGCSFSGSFNVNDNAQGATGNFGPSDIAKNPFLNGEYKGVAISSCSGAGCPGGKPHATITTTQCKGSDCKTNTQQADPSQLNIPGGANINAGSFIGGSGQGFGSGCSPATGCTTSSQSNYQGTFGSAVFGPGCPQGVKGGCQQVTGSQTSTSNSFSGSSHQTFSGSTADGTFPANFPTNIFNNQGTTSSFGTGQVSAIDYSKTSPQPSGKTSPDGACYGQGLTCVKKHLCVNGFINNNGDGLLQVRDGDKYCDVNTEVCCQLPGSSGVPHKDLSINLPSGGDQPNFFSTSSQHSSSSSAAAAASSSNSGSTSSFFSSSNPNPINPTSRFPDSRGQSSPTPNHVPGVYQPSNPVFQPGQTINFGGKQGTSPGVIQVVPDTQDEYPTGTQSPNLVRPDSGSLTHILPNGEIATPVGSASTISPNSVQISPSGNNFNQNELNFASTIQGPAYLPPGPSPSPSPTNYSPDLLPPNRPNEPSPPQYRPTPSPPQPRPTQPQYQPTPTQPQYRPTPSQPQYRPPQPSTPVPTSYYPTSTRYQPTTSAPEYLPPYSGAPAGQPPAYVPPAPTRRPLPPPPPKVTNGYLPPTNEIPSGTVTNNDYLPPPKDDRKVDNKGDSNIINISVIPPNVPQPDQKPIPTPDPTTPRTRPTIPDRRPQTGPPPRRPPTDRDPSPTDQRGTVLGFPSSPRPNEFPLNTTPYPGCAAALKCVQEEFCTAEGVISATRVLLTPEQEINRVPLTECQDPESGIIGKCCRDPDYKDPWPSTQLGLFNPDQVGAGSDNGHYRQQGNDGQYRPNNNNNGGVKGRVPQGNVPRPFNPYDPNVASSNPNAVIRPGYQTVVPNAQFDSRLVNRPVPVDVRPPIQGDYLQKTPNRAKFSNENCGVRNENGRPAGPGPIDANFAEIPWQAMILRDTNRSLLCGGAIIRRDVVLTAAHCVENLQANDVLVKGGEWKLGIDEEPKPFQINKVATIVRHPGYNPQTRLNDVALLILTEKFRSDKNVDTLCLPDANEDVSKTFQSAKCITTGWGKTILQLNIVNSIMHILGVGIMQGSQCQQQLQQYHSDSAHLYNANCVCGAPVQPEANICDVDVGSALACDRGDGRYTLAGIYSWDTGCNPTAQIAGYTKVDTQWIESTLQRPVKDLKTEERGFYAQLQSQASAQECHCLPGK